MLNAFNLKKKTLITNSRNILVFYLKGKRKNKVSIPTLYTRVFKSEYLGLK